MKIVHVAPNASFTDGWGYHENLLPKYQSLLGHDVLLIVLNVSRPQQKLVTVPCGSFISTDGFKVVRRALNKCFLPFLTHVFSNIDIYDLLLEFKPDYIHFHGLVSNTINQVVRYKKKENKDAVIVMDNHLDYNIGAIHLSSFNHFLIRSYYRFLFRKNRKYINKVYGVTPWRMQYAINVFRVPPKMVDLLIMGGDDKMLQFSNKSDIRRQTRQEYNIGLDDFLIVSGGKIDARKRIHLLMEACGKLKKIKLVIFGSICEDINTQFKELLGKYSNITYIGWASAKKQYDLYFAADLVVFPGQHSVLWEQACAAKVPCLFGKWDKMDYLNNGGNSDFIEDVSADGIKRKIEEVINTNKYNTMKQVAESHATDIFLYSHVAMKSLHDFE